MVTPQAGRRAVERAATRAEAPVRAVVGSNRANPLPHAGTISVFLLGVVTLSGIYITLFFEYGFEASYEAVDGLQDHPIQRVVRALHRYSSAALVVTTIVHAWRIFVAGRFTAGRRHRWLTGVAALALVWLAGVTGYWLVWDLRAQALAESLERVIGGFGWGAALVVNRLIGTGAGSGAAVMVVVWVLHVLLTVVIGWFIWRHIRHSRLAMLPPRHWMLLMGGGLVALSLVLPADLLDPADPGRLVPDMALDPFILFLLPPLLSDHAGLVVIAAVAALGIVALIPWLLRDRGVAVVAIDADQCTGCELCVVDCPYVALSMVDRSDGPSRGRLAVVDAAACVGCGICLGSCSFGAMSLPEMPAVESIDCEGRNVVVACRRHARQRSDLEDDNVLVEVECTGMFHAAAIGDLMRRGAQGVQIVGCAPGDCTYGIGSMLTHERLDGSRSPHVPRRYEGVAAEDYVPVGELGSAARHPGAHPDPDADSLPGSRRSRVAAAGVVGASLVGIGAATLLPFGGEAADAAVRVVVDHEPGAQLIGQSQPTGRPDEPTTVVVVVNGTELDRSTLPRSGGSAVGVVDVPVSPGEATLRVLVLEGEPSPTVLYDGPAIFGDGRRFLLEARDVPPPPGVKEGKRVFSEPRLGGCGVCHSTSAGDDGVGPSLAGVATRAATTVPGMSAEDYLLTSVIAPDAYIVPGYRAGQMLPIYQDRLSSAEIDSLVQYLLTLEEEKR